MIEFETEEEATLALNLTGTELADKALVVTPADLNGQAPSIVESKTDAGLEPIENRSVLVTNLSFTLLENDVRSFFHQCGPILSVKLSNDFTKATKDAIVEYSDSESAAKAVGISGTELASKAINVITLAQNNEMRRQREKEREARRVIREQERRVEDEERRVHEEKRRLEKEEQRLRHMDDRKRHRSRSRDRDRHHDSNSVRSSGRDREREVRDGRSSRRSRERSVGRGDRRYDSERTRDSQLDDGRRSTRNQRGEDRIPDRSRDRSRERIPDRSRDRSRERIRERSRDRIRERSRERIRERSRERTRDRDARVQSPRSLDRSREKNLQLPLQNENSNSKMEIVDAKNTLSPQNRNREPLNDNLTRENHEVEGKGSKKHNELSPDPSDASHNREVGRESPRKSEQDTSKRSSKLSDEIDRGRDSGELRSNHLTVDASRSHEREQFRSTADPAREIRPNRRDLELHLRSKDQVHSDEKSEETHTARRKDETSRRHTRGDSSPPLPPSTQITSSPAVKSTTRLITSDPTTRNQPTNPTSTVEKPKNLQREEALKALLREELKPRSTAPQSPSEQPVEDTLVREESLRRELNARRLLDQAKVREKPKEFSFKLPKLRSDSGRFN